MVAAEWLLGPEGRCGPVPGRWQRQPSRAPGAWTDGGRAPGPQAGATLRRLSRRPRVALVTCPRPSSRSDCARVSVRTHTSVLHTF